MNLESIGPPPYCGRPKCAKNWLPTLKNVDSGTNYLKSNPDQRWTVKVKLQKKQIWCRAEIYLILPQHSAGWTRNGRRWGVLAATHCQIRSLHIPIFIVSVASAAATAAAFSQFFLLDYTTPPFAHCLLGQLKSSVRYASNTSSASCSVPQRPGTDSGVGRATGELWVLQAKTGGTLALTKEAPRV